MRRERPEASLRPLPRAYYAAARARLAPCVRPDANATFDAFVETYAIKYDKAVGCLTKDREALLAFYDFPAEHWKHLRTTDEIDKAFSGSLAHVGTGRASEALAAPFVRRRHGGKKATRMRLCQRRQPPEAVAAGQRLQSRVLVATIGRGARRAALFKGKVAGSRTLVCMVSSACTGDRGAKSKAGG
jgi:hypothetical protein